MVSHWSLSDIKSSQVSLTFLSIPANLNIVIWMVSTHPIIPKSSKPFYQTFTIGHIVNLTKVYHAAGNGLNFVSTSAQKNSVNIIIGDIGMLLRFRVLKSLNSFEKTQQRMT